MTAKYISKIGLTIASLIILTIVTTSSKSDSIDKNKVRTLSISLQDIKLHGKVSDLFSINKLIPLEASDKSLINFIDKVKVASDRIFIYDYKSQRLLQFKNNGDFLRQIGQRGKGPGEYLELNDFEIDPKNEIVYLLDYKRIHSYSFKGDYIGTNKTEYFGYKIVLSNDNGFFFYGARMDDKLIVTNPKFRLQATYFPYSPAYEVDNLYSFSQLADKTFFHLPRIDTIYEIINGSPVPSFFVNFNGRNFTSEDYSRLSEADKNNISEYQFNDRHHLWCVGFLPCQDHVFLAINYRGQGHLGLYNLKTDNKEFVDVSKIENDLFGIHVPFYPRGVTENEYIIDISPHALIDDKTSAFYLANKTILENLSEYSNPVLLFAKPVL